MIYFPLNKYFSAKATVEGEDDPVPNLTPREDILENLNQINTSYIEVAKFSLFLIFFSSLTSQVLLIFYFHFHTFLFCLSSFYPSPSLIPPNIPFSNFYLTFAAADLAMCPFFPLFLLLLTNIVLLIFFLCH